MNVLSNRISLVLLSALLLGLLLGGQFCLAQEKICALDMGSNSFKFAIGEFIDGRVKLSYEVRDSLEVGDDIQRSFQKTGRFEISEKKTIRHQRSVHPLQKSLL